MQKRLLRAREAAEYIGTSLSTFWEFVKEGKFERVFLGKKMVRFDVRDLDNYIDSLKASR